MPTQPNWLARLDFTSVAISGRLRCLSDESNSLLNCCFGRLVGGTCDCPAGFAGADCSSCANDFYAAMGGCHPKNSVGASCESAEQCENSFACVDGVCCSNGPCSSKATCATGMCACLPGYESSFPLRCDLCAATHVEQGGECVPRFAAGASCDPSLSGSDCSASLFCEIWSIRYIN